MKRLTFLLILLLLLVGCSKDNNENKQLSVVVPSGAPALAFYNELDNSNFNTGDAQSILPELKSENGSDVIVIDTVSGIKALNAGAKYKLAATITFGNFYIASTGNDDNGVMDDGDYIVLFSQGATPDLLFHHIYGDALDSNLHYVSAVADASACLIKGINISDEDRKVDEQPYVEYVLIAQPALSVALTKNENIKVYADMQDEYYKSSGGLQMIQASVFVSDRLTDTQINEYLNGLENTINDLINDPNLFAQGVSELSDDEIKDIFGVANSKIAVTVLKNNSIGLGYRKAIDNKQAIDSYLRLFNMEETNEEIYVK